MPKNSKKNPETESKDKEIEFTNEGSVTIEYDAFRMMISHTLRFANDSKEENTQVFGICIGEYSTEADRYIITDVIPITHGDFIELGFSEEIHEIMDGIKSQYIDTSKRVIGWYHSHLGYGLYFSDRANNLYFQHTENPYGFGVVIEQTLLNEDQNYGIEVFRLKDYSKGAESDYVKVAFDIAPPNSMKLFKWVQELVESTQNKDSKIIYELNEVIKPSPELLQEIPTPKEEEEESEEKEDFSLLYGVNDGIGKFKDSFIKTYEQQLTSWMYDVSDDILIGSEYIRSSINNIKTTLSSGLEDAQRVFDRIFSEISTLFMKNTRASIDTRLEKQIELKKTIQVITEEQLRDLFELLEKEIREVTNIFEEEITSIKKELEKISQSNNTIKESLIQNNEMLRTLYDETDKLSDNIIQYSQKSSKVFEAKIIDELESFSNKMSPNKEIYGEIEELIERLQKVISDLRQVK
jgi:proteasome lid subunit RPN8/RPN11